MRYLLRNGGFCMGGDLIITGGMPLNGTVHIPATKNSVLPLLAAALLCNGTVRFLQVPHLADVDTSVELLQGAGCTARWQGSDITVQGVPSTCRLAPEAAARMRASILFCAPLLARLGRVETVLPGGCRIGARPVDLHLPALRRWACTAGRRGKADPDSACRAARCGHYTWVPQRGCYRDPASGSSCGAGRDGPARGRTRTGDQRSGSIPEPLRRLCTGRGHQHHPGAGQTNAV